MSREPGVWPWRARLVCPECGRDAADLNAHCENCGACGPEDGCQVCAGSSAPDVVTTMDAWFDETVESLPQER
jgi:predicted amidophosphoribosyltransferase